jgi:L-alanine-DL-glutamate epimerase-like enolase superfamily enzyme
LGDDFPLMVDANQQWDRETAIRMGRKMEPFNLIWIEEPLMPTTLKATRSCRRAGYADCHRRDADQLPRT